MIDEKIQKFIKACKNDKQSKLYPDAFVDISDFSPYCGNLNSLSQEVGWQIESFDFPSIWSKTKGEKIKVAVLDTGVDISHPDLKIKRSVDFVNIRLTDWWDPINNKVIANDIDYNTYTPTHNHGTHVSGIIGAKDNDIGMVGVAPECEIYALRVLNESGSGSFTDIAISLLWCLFNEKIDIVNMSLGGFWGNEFLWMALKELYDSNIPVIVSAGNAYHDSNYRGYISFPAQYDETISVGAIDVLGERAYFSSVGPNLDVVAPGVGILSTIIGGGYASYSGTSMSAPFISGLASLILAKHKKLGGNTPIKTVEDLRNHIVKFAKNTSSFDRDIYTGWGIVSPEKSILSIRPKESPPKVAFGRYYAGSILSYNDKPWILK